MDKDQWGRGGCLAWIKELCLIKLDLWAADGWQLCDVEYGGAFNINGEWVYDKPFPYVLKIITLFWNLISLKFSTWNNHMCNTLVKTYMKVAEIMLPFFFLVSRLLPLIDYFFPLTVLNGGQTDHLLKQLNH